MTIDLSSEDFEKTVAIQQAVSDPRVSAWVSANAGSGKTHVLTNRVIRLLMGDGDQLRGVQPSSILCITYTKAAAAEMQARLFRTLGEWALMEDGALKSALENRLGAETSVPDLTEVRRLFARSLDAPGGLRIQTIHAFCESLLRRFPVEAGLLPGFAVLEDSETADIRACIVRDLLREAESAPWAEDFFLLLDAYGDIQAMMAVLEQEGARDTRVVTAEFLRQRLKISSAAEPDQIAALAMSRIEKSFLRSLEVAHDELTAEYDGKPQKYDLQSRVARKILSAGPEEAAELFDEAVAAFLTAKRELPSEKTCKGNNFVRARIPDYPEQCLRTCILLADAVTDQQAAEIYNFTCAVRRMGAEVARRYASVKTARGALDFDDLIARADHLVTSYPDGWIRYKLDNGISHLLLDEAQDTGAVQWSVINSLRDGFWRGTSDEKAPRTAFVVGDKKQSIYSFQGADARLFDAQKKKMESAAASHPYKDATLFLSFRSAQSVLDTVDTLFEDEAGLGLYGEARETHAPAKPKLAGAVELWPLVRKPEKKDADLWTLPVDAGGAMHPHRRLSQEIVRDIEEFMRAGMVVDKEGHARRPRYGDIMILCQRRTGIFPEIVRTLALRGIPNGGTDRVKLKDDVAVQDLLAALRFATSHADDLSLAELLKSPFAGFTDDDLFVLAHDRATSRLWARLRGARDETALGQRCTDIVARIERAEEAGRRLGAFAFLSSLLEEGQPNGRYLLRQRLGDASDDALDELMSEALTFDAQNPRTLNGFLAHLENLSTDIKKEFGEESDVVRIMTVHGAKGLEAPVVYLADAGYLPRPRYDGIPLLEKGEEDGVFVRVPSGIKHPVTEEGKNYLRAREMQEYRRKLYVAATRAEQRLVICGTESGRLSEKHATPDDAAMEKAPVDASWYGLAMQAYGRVAPRITTKPCPWREDMNIRVIAGGEVMPVVGEGPLDTPHDTTFKPPDWLFVPAEKETSPTVYFPSSYDEEDEGAVLPPRHSSDEPSPRQRGLAIHQLLELLPSLPSDQWSEAADRMLARQAAEQSEAVRVRWRDEALTVLKDPAFGRVFGPDGQPEVALRGRLGERVYAGQVDRLLITPEEILVVDYKTMRPPPMDAAATPPGILRQMAIYQALLAKRFPDTPVRAAILWTYSPRLMPLPEDLLAKTIESIAS